MRTCTLPFANISAFFCRGQRWRWTSSPRRSLSGARTPRVTCWLPARASTAPTTCAPRPTQARPTSRAAAAASCSSGYHHHPPPPPPRQRVAAAAARRRSLKPPPPSGTRLATSSSVRRNAAAAAAASRSSSRVGRATRSARRAASRPRSSRAGSWPRSPAALDAKMMRDPHQQRSDEEREKWRRGRSVRSVVARCAHGCAMVTSGGNEWASDANALRATPFSPHSGSPGAGRAARPMSAQGDIGKRQLASLPKDRRPPACATRMRTPSRSGSRLGRATPPAEGPWCRRNFISRCPELQPWRDFSCFHAGRPAWETRLIPGGGEFFSAGSKFRTKTWLSSRFCVFCGAKQAKTSPVRRLSTLN